METLKSKINSTSTEYQDKQKFFKELAEKHKNILGNVYKGGGEKALSRHKSRGKLPVRERINLLVDVNTPFLELSSLAAYNKYDNAFPSAGIVTGIGIILFGI